MFSIWLCDIVKTYLLGARETVYFVIRDPVMFPEAQPRESSADEGSQNILLSRGPSN